MWIILSFSLKWLECRTFTIYGLLFWLKTEKTEIKFNANEIEMSKISTTKKYATKNYENMLQSQIK